MNTPVAPSIEQVVDTERYPLFRPGSEAWHAAVEKVRADLARDGCSVLSDFVRPAYHDLLRREGASMAPRAHDDEEVVNAYNIPVDADLPEDHPARIRLHKRNAFVAYDHIPADALIRHLYTDEHFKRFLAACVGLPEIHELADPSPELVLNVVAPAWTTRGTSTPTSSPSAAHPARSPAASSSTARTSVPPTTSTSPTSATSWTGGAAADATADPAHRRPATVQGPLLPAPGDSARRDTERHSAIFAYSARPGVVGSVARTRQFFGRVLTEAHLGRRGASRAVPADSARSD